MLQWGIFDLTSDYAWSEGTINDYSFNFATSFNHAYSISLAPTYIGVFVSLKGSLNIFANTCRFYFLANSKGQGFRYIVIGT